MRDLQEVRNIMTKLIEPTVYTAAMCLFIASAFVAQGDMPDAPKEEPQERYEAALAECVQVHRKVCGFNSIQDAVHCQRALAGRATVGTCR